MSFGNGEGSHSEMGRENSMTCRAKLTGTVSRRRGRKRKWRGLAHSARHGTKNLLNGGVPLLRNVLNHHGEKLTGTVSQWRDKERIQRGLSHSARQGTNTLWNGTLRKSVLTHRKENVQARKWEEN